MNASTFGIIEIVIIIGVAIFLFFLFREVSLWYFKINESVELQKEKVFLLRKMAQASGISPEELVYRPQKKKK